MTMGEKILALRKARGWSQEELAEQIGVTRQAVSRWESGAAKPDADKIIAVCDLFGVSADYLLRDFAGSAAAEPVQTVETRQTTAIGDAIRGLTLKQWFLLIAAVAGMTMQVFLRFAYAFQDVNYVDYMGFIHFNELGFLHYASIVCCVVPAVIGAFKWLWNQASEFFYWNG